MKKYAPFRSANSHELTFEERQKAAAVVNSAMTPEQRTARALKGLKSRWGNKPKKGRRAAA